jgi:glucoamylase
MDHTQPAPGGPGIAPHWTSSAKSGVGTALSTTSHVWFTISHGILDEIYYPRVDLACTRDMGLIITDGQEFFSDEKRHTRSQVEYLAKGAPAYRLTNTCLDRRYRIEKEIIADPARDVVLQRTRFVPLQGTLADYHLYVVLAPHLGNRGFDNSGWTGDYKGISMLFAEREGMAALALGCSVPWLQRSVGFVGASDGWQDLNEHRRMTWSYARAENGNVALTGEVDLQANDGAFVLALGFDSHALSAGHHARASLLDGFDVALAQYIEDWQQWQSSLLSLEGGDNDQSSLYRISTAVLHTHEAKQFPGGLIASLSIPWGFAKGDDDLGGYHLVWTRDLVETVGGLVAAGAQAAARRVLRYLQVTQEADGHWPQNMWLDGTPYWGGVQLDEVGFPILLAAQAWREGTLETDEVGQLWPMVREAAGFIARNGPVTQQDRWEEDAGYSPFTLAVTISALLAAAELAELANQPAVATYLRQTADAWNANIERWTYVTGTDLADQLGVDGYYIRIAPPDTPDAASPKHGFVPIKNRPPGQSAAPAEQIVSPDALALVRFGLRAPDDPRIVNTIKAVDALLKVETPYGPIWHRYNHDGYGEHADGAPFDGTGIGRAWPLLVGERAHYELAAGHEDEARRLMHAMEAFANEGGMLPEQVWDAPDIPERELHYGRPSGSAMPLVWAHAEYIKLRRSLREKRVFDLPPQTIQRYLAERAGSPYTAWRFNHKIRTMPSGKSLRLEVLAPARVHWSADGWRTPQDADTRDTCLGVHVVDLPTERLPASGQVVFTFYWVHAERWEGTDFEVNVEGG